MTTELDHILNHRSLRKSRRRWRWLAIAALLALVIGLAAPFFADGQVRSPHIARLEVSGLITGPQEQLDLLKDIAKDDHAKALLLRIDSPGGTTAGSEALYEAIRKVAEKKPVVAVMDTVAASGGYITALAADRIYARGNTITGSIGVIFSYPEVSVLLSTLGVKMEELKSGDLKAEPSPYKPASEKAKAVAMEMVMDGFVWFKGLVSERRKLTPARTDVLADGRVYTGRQAVKEGLIDALGAEEDAVSWLEKERKLAADLPVVTRSPPKDLAGNYLGASIANRLLAYFGLGALAGSMTPPKLDGLLVLWHPQS